jgi:hypothetical protein
MVINKSGKSHLITFKLPVYGKTKTLRSWKAPLIRPGNFAPTKQLFFERLEMLSSV